MKRTSTLGGVVSMALLAGAVPNVIFATGIVRFKDQWLLYYNGGDWMMNVAAAPAR